jgi:hypothetical protein
VFFGRPLENENLICNLVHGDASKLPVLAPRLDFNTACQVI